MGTRFAIPPSAVPPIMSSESEASLSSRIADSSPVGSQTIGQVGAGRPADGGRFEPWPVGPDPCCPSRCEVPFVGPLSPVAASSFPAIPSSLSGRGEPWRDGSPEAVIMIRRRRVAACGLLDEVGDGSVISDKRAAEAACGG